MEVGRTLQEAWDWAYASRAAKKAQQQKVKKRIVHLPGENFRRAYFVQIPVDDPQRWQDVVLVVTSARLLVLDDDHLLVETDIARISHAKNQDDLAHLTLRGDGEDIRVTLRTQSKNRARSLRRRAVDAAEKRLAGRDQDQTPSVGQKIAQAVHLAAEVKHAMDEENR